MSPNSLLLNQTISLLLNSYFSLKNFAESDVEAYGLDASDTDVEKVPLVITPVSNLQLERF